MARNSTKKVNQRSSAQHWISYRLLELINAHATAFGPCYPLYALAVVYDCFRKHNLMKNVNTSVNMIIDGQEVEVHLEFRGGSAIASTTNGQVKRHNIYGYERLQGRATRFVNEVVSIAYVDSSDTEILWTLQGLFYSVIENKLMPQEPRATHSSNVCICLNALLYATMLSENLKGAQLIVLVLWAHLISSNWDAINKNMCTTKGETRPLAVVIKHLVDHQILSRNIIEKLTEAVKEQLESNEAYEIINSLAMKMSADGKKHDVHVQEMFKERIPKYARATVRLACALTLFGPCIFMMKNLSIKTISSWSATEFVVAQEEVAKIANAEAGARLMRVNHKLYGVIEALVQRFNEPTQATFKELYIARLDVLQGTKLTIQPFTLEDLKWDGTHQIKPKNSKKRQRAENGENDHETTQNRANLHEVLIQAQVLLTNARSIFAIVEAPQPFNTAVDDLSTSIQTMDNTNVQRNVAEVQKMLEATYAKVERNANETLTNCQRTVERAQRLNTENENVNMYLKLVDQSKDDLVQALSELQSTKEQDKHVKIVHIHGICSEANRLSERLGETVSLFVNSAQGFDVQFATRGSMDLDEYDISSQHVLTGLLSPGPEHNQNMGDVRKPPNDQEPGPYLIPTPEDSADAMDI